MGGGGGGSTQGVFCLSVAMRKFCDSFVLLLFFFFSFLFFSLKFILLSVKHCEQVL